MEKPANRKVILHFDARNTIFLTDKYSKLSPEYALNCFLAGAVWGVIDPDTQEWQCISKEPTMEPPSPEAISIYKIFEHKIVKEPKDRQTLRETLGTFTSTDNGKKFYPLVEENLRHLRWKHSENSSDKLTVKGLDGKLYHYILPCFFNLILWLKKNHRDFCIVIRTFSRDAPFIVDAIEAFLNGEHPDYPAMIDIDIDKNIQYFHRDMRDHSLTYKYTDKSGAECELTRERDIYEHWSRSSGVIAAVDDFMYWRSNNYLYQFAKCLMFQRNCPHYHHIMFDDNARVGEDDSMMYLKEMTEDEEINIGKESIKKYQDIFFVQANLLESAKDPEYFINKLKQCEMLVNNIS